MKTLLSEFDYLRPETLDEALDMIREHGDDASVIAGGTDLVIKIAEKIMSPKTLIDIGRIEELDQIFEEDEVIHIGAMTTFDTIENSSLIREKTPVLHLAAASVGNAQVRNRGTIGGNLANASPAADSAPPLLALDCEVVLTSHAGERVLPLTAFFLDLEKTAIEADELLKEIRIPLNGSKALPSSFIKLGKRKAACLSVVCTAVVLAHSSGVCTKARIGIGAVAPTPMRAKAAEAFLEGKTLSDQVIAEAADLAVNETTPISDIRASREYRKEMSRVLVRRGIEQVLQS